MKIAFILPGYGESGGSKIIYRYANEFKKRGHEVVLFYPLIPYNLYRDNNPLFFLKQVKGTVMRMYHALKKDKYNNMCKEMYKPVLTVSDLTIKAADVVIATAWPTAYSVFKLKRNNEKKFYFIQDFEVWDNYEKGMQSYKLPLKKITISKWIRDQLFSVGIKEEIPIIRNGIDDKLFFFKERSSMKSIKCCMMYHDLKKKGVKNGIAAFEKAKQVRPNIELILFGLKKPQSYDMPYQFVENPSRDELANLYSNSDIFIYPSLEEGWGLTVIESMASGCAVVGTNTGCLIEVGRNGENALISEPGDVDKMTNNIVRLCDDSKLRQSISKNAALIIQELSWDKSVNMFLNILDKT